MIQRLFRYLLGYCVIEIKGLLPEKCVNIMLARGVPVWDIRRAGACVMRAAVAYHALGRAREAAQQSGCVIVEKRRRGLPYLCVRMWRRKALLLGCLLVLLGSAVSTRIVWTIEIEGTEKIEEEDIQRILTRCGLKQGAWIPGIDRKQIEDKLLLAMPGIAWAGLSIDGVNATMKVVEAVPVPPMEDRSVPRDIIAAREGIIERMIVLEGAAQVKEGDYVSKGQLLVSGTIYHERNDVTRRLHSMAEVWIRTYYTGECLIPPQKSGLVPTGESARVLYLSQKDTGREHRIAGRVPEYRLRAVEDEPIGPVLFGWRLTLRHYREMEREKADPAEWSKTLKEAEQRTYREVLAALPERVKIIDKTTRYDMISDGGVRLSVWVQVLEDIALPVNIGG